MLVEEIKEKLSTSEIIDLSTIIEIKPYLSYVEKKIICENIIKASLEQDENGLFVCDYFNRKLTTDISIIVNYTDIELGEEFLEDYDYLCEQGIVDYIFNNMNKSDRYFIKDMVSKSVKQEINIGNGIEGILSKGITKLTDKIPTDKQLKSLSKTLVKDINKLDWDKIPMLKQMWLTANGKSGGQVGE